VTGPLTTPTVVTPAEAAARLGEFTVVDVRTPGEYASGRLPGAYNARWTVSRRPRPRFGRPPRAGPC
jgi:rhodanese-related sulfurtransferase